MIVAGLLGCGGPPVATAADRKVPLTASQAAPYAMAGPATVDASRETWHLAQGEDGAWSLEYDYADDRLVVNFAAQVARDAEAAGWAYTGYGIGKTFVEGTEGIELVETLPEALVWGEEAECELLRSSGIDVGFVCRGRHGDRAFLVTVAGIRPQGDAAPARLLAGPLSALDAWEPANR